MDIVPGCIETISDIMPASERIFAVVKDII
jgi:hypothetical protein